MSEAPDPAAIRAYVARRWAAVESAKRQHWANEFRARGHEAALTASQALWQHMRTVRPDWPTADDRRRDLEHHIALKRAIDRAARVVAGLPAR